LQESWIDLPLLGEYQFTLLYLSPVLIWDMWSLAFLGELAKIRQILPLLLSL
jgi:hypothetical protein